jgi:uncharacterized protein YidB (DUF937 family)
MGLLDDAMNKATSALGAESSANPLIGQLTQFVESQGGLSAVVQSFRDKGFGTIVSSWVSTGQNLPIDSSQLQQMLGSEQVQQIAAKAGLSPDLVSGGLAAALPQLIDRLTPNGTIPPA